MRFSVVSLCIAAMTLSAAEQKSAVLIGIDIYNPKNLAPLKEAGPVVKRPQARGNWSGWVFPDLRGAVKDVELMQSILVSDKLGFKDIAVLKNQDATANAILATLQRKLIDETAPGDIRVVFYSGHGSTVRKKHRMNAISWTRRLCRRTTTKAMFRTFGTKSCRGYCGRPGRKA